MVDIYLNKNIINDEVYQFFNLYNLMKEKGILYHHDYLPQIIIKHFITYEDNKEYNLMLEEFKCQYIYSESEIEKSHAQEEREGLSFVYDYIKNKNNSEDISFISEIRNIHKLLFSACPYPEAGGKFRNMQYYLPGSFIELTPPENILTELLNLYDEFEEILKFSDNINKNTSKPNDCLEYIKKVVRFKCKLIKIHPFSDGNGRTMRAFLNLLLKRVNIPPVYVRPKENLEYRKNMEKALKNNDYESIEIFYLFKVCDSIAELNYGLVSKDLEFEINELDCETKKQK